MAIDQTAPAEIVGMISGLVTTAIAVIVAIIAWQNWETNRAVLREKLFDRRFQVFRETQEFLSEIMRDAKFTSESFWKYTDTCQRARFLLGRPAANFLLEIRRRANQMNYHQTMVDSPTVGAERPKHISDQHEHLVWLVAQLDLLFDHFEPFLGFEKHK